MVPELFDTEQARPAATAILVRFTDQSAEVLLLKRNETLKHMPGLWVFQSGTTTWARCAGAPTWCGARLQEEAGCHCLHNPVFALANPASEKAFQHLVFLASDDDTPVTVTRWR